MSRADLGFAYAQARLQARHGNRPTTADWNQLEATADLAAALQVIRNSSLARWTGRLGARPDIHEIERRLREEWARAVDEIAAWQPGPWRAAIGWLRWLPWLQPLDKLARGGHAPAWMREDTILGPVVAREPLERSAALRRTALAPLEAGFAADSDVADAWLRAWRASWPGQPAATVTLEGLLREVALHAGRLEESPAASGSRDSTQVLSRRLLFYFRRNPLTPAATAAFVGLLALDVQRLRGLLAVRSLREPATAAS